MEAVKLHKSEKIGLIKWETRVETPRCTWYFHAYTRRGSARQALAHFKELTRDSSNSNRSTT